jgi:hypothetical protein
MKLTKEVLGLLVEVATTDAIVNVLDNILKDSWGIDEDILVKMLLGSYIPTKYLHEQEKALDENPEMWMCNKERHTKGSTVITGDNPIKEQIYISYFDSMTKDTVNTTINKWDFNRVMKKYEEETKEA